MEEADWVVGQAWRLGSSEEVELGCISVFVSVVFFPALFGYPILLPCCIPLCKASVRVLLWTRCQQQHGWMDGWMDTCISGGHYGWVFQCCCLMVLASGSGLHHMDRGEEEAA